MLQLSISSGPAATSIVIGDPNNPVPVMIQNVDPANTLWLGSDSGASPNDPTATAPLLPGASAIADGTQDVYGIADTGKNVLVYVYRGVVSFFQPPSLVSLGGAKVFVQTTTPTGTIPANSLWFNTATGALLTYTGGTWVNRQLNAQQAIVAASITAGQVANGTLTTAQLAAAAGILGGQIATATITSGNIAANTIVAANIAANTITAAQLAAGIIYAGIVNGTTIQGATFRLLNSFGAVDGLWDSGTDALFIYTDTGSAVQGALISSLASKVVTDPVTSVSVPQGLYSQQITLANQSVAPPSFANASIYYSSNAGRPRYKSSSGADNTIQRSDINVSQVTVGNTTTPSPISTALSYNLNEGNQSSEYEVEISGTINWSTGTLNSPIFQLFVDGAAIGGGTQTQFTVGVSGQTASQISGFTIRISISILTTGVSGTVVGRADGIIWNQSANRIPGNSVAVGAMTSSVGFDTTTNHSLVIYAWWAAAATGQQMQSVRTRVTRRM